MPTDEEILAVLNNPVVQEVEETPEQAVKKLHEKIGTILAEHNGQESDIGFRHEYWTLMNQLRALLKK